MTEREEILTGRVKIGQAACYQISDRGKPVKKVSFILVDESIISFSYSYFHLACGTENYLTFEFSRGEVAVKGRNLAKISRAIGEHRLVYLAESRNLEGNSSNEPIVEKITVFLRGAPIDVGNHVMGWE